MPLMVQTVHSGTITVREQDIITFPSGIIGFEGTADYCIVQRESLAGLHILQACPKGPAFALLDCRALTFPYNVQVELSDLIDLDIQRGDRIQTFVLITLTAHQKDSTINLMAPLAINRRSRLGKQVVQWQTPYTTKHPLMDEIKTIAGCTQIMETPGITRVTVAFT